jgi:hypothetical protein
MTYTGRLINEDAQVSIENGPILAVRGPNPVATAAGQYARFGQTQPVIVTGDPDTLDNLSVLYVTNIQWAAQALAAAGDDASSDGGVESLSDAAAPGVQKAPPPKPAAKKAQRKSK